MPNEPTNNPNNETEVAPEWAKNLENSLSNLTETLKNLFPQQEQTPENQPLEIPLPEVPEQDHPQPEEVPQPEQEQEQEKPKKRSFLDWIL